MNPSKYISAPVFILLLSFCLSPKVSIVLADEVTASTTSISIEQKQIATQVIMVSGISDIIKRQLVLGSSGPDVKLLQKLLSKDSSIYPEGYSTGYFGILTQKAVQKFQEKQGIASVGSPGYGQVGPKTKAKLMEIFGQ